MNSIDGNSLQCENIPEIISNRAGNNIESCILLINIKSIWKELNAFGSDLVFYDLDDLDISLQGLKE